MSVGLSIFLSAVFLGMVALHIFTRQMRFLWAAFMLFGTVALYVSTKERWDWKKLVRKTILWSTIIAVGLAILGGLGLSIYAWSKSRPRVQDNFWDIPLGATKADVRFCKGEPSTISEDVWTYTANHDTNSHVYVRFSEDRVDRVIGGRMYEELQGIRLGISTPTDIRKKFGEPTEVHMAEDNLSRSFWYAKYHVFFLMEQNTVMALGVYDPQTSSKGEGSRAPDTNIPDQNESELPGKLGIEPGIIGINRGTPDSIPPGNE